VIFIALVAAGFSLLIAQISYPFLHYVVITPGAPGGADFSKEFEVLDGEVMRRTFPFRVAWWFSVFAVAIPLFLIFITFLRDLLCLLRRG